MTSLLHRRWFRRLLWTLITLLTLWVLLAVVLSWSGQRRWLRLKAELDAAGETLDFIKLLPPPIAEAQNFAAIEPLNGIRLAPGDSPAAKAAQAKRDAISKACQFLRDQPVSQALALEGLKKAQPPDLAKIITALREQKQLQLPPNADAKALRQALEQHLPMLTQLAEAARTRSQVEFLPRWDAANLPENLFTLAMPHYTLAQDLSRAQWLHGLACLESGDPAAAVSDVIAILRLAKGALHEPFLIGHLVGITQQFTAAELTWVLLQKRALTAEMLQTLQQGFQGLDIPASLLLASRGEMAAGADMGELLERDPWRAVELFSMIQSEGPAKAATFENTLMLCIPTGFFTHMKTSLVQAEWEHLVRINRDQGLKNALVVPEPLEVWVKSQNLLSRPDNMLARLALPAMGQVKRSSALAENTRLQAFIACALELHFLQHGRDPPKLEDLANTSLTTFDGTPMHYRPSADGRYRLWHSGPDGQDDDGALAAEKPQKKKDASPRSPDYLGDWTWRYEAVK
jgi:hypothetical protein